MCTLQTMTQRERDTFIHLVAGGWVAFCIWKLFCAVVNAKERSDEIVGRIVQLMSLHVSQLSFHYSLCVPAKHIANLQNRRNCNFLTCLFLLRHTKKTQLQICWNGWCNFDLSTWGSENTFAKLIVHILPAATDRPATKIGRNSSTISGHNTKTWYLYVNSTEAFTG